MNDESPMHSDDGVPPAQQSKGPSRRPARKRAAPLQEHAGLAQAQASDMTGEAGLGHADTAQPVSEEPRETRRRREGGRPRKGEAAQDNGYHFADVVSGTFDADEERADLLPTKRVLQPQAETPKLHKVLAQAGLGSRIEMEQMILEGRISVNNEPAHIGQRVQYGDQVKINGKPIRFRIEPPPVRVIAYHKPVGEVVTHDDPQNRPTVFRKLPRLMQGKWQSVGRLDLNTEGLLLFTSSGDLANKLMHPRFGLQREYAARVLGALSDEERQRLLDGVQLEDGMAAFGSVDNGGGEGVNCWYRVTISEGRNREVRRMFEAVGHAVSRLIRIRYGAMMLPRGLKRGAWVELDEHDIRALMQAAGMNERPRAASNDGGRAGAGRRGGPGGRGPGGGQRQSQSQSPQRRGGRGSGGAGQPDPMKTSLGYIGMDSLSRQREGQKRGGGSRRGGR
jgi:23S rRNA pseudouridine2605 synthase